MRYDSDVALVGTGVGPLVAASFLLSQGLSVLVLNPDHDFFLEDSELPIDPLWPLDERSFSREQIELSIAENALAELQPEFPGSIEYVDGGQGKGYRDPSAPYVRKRSRLWMRPSRDLEALERYFLHADEVKLAPQILDGISAAKRFPGFNAGEVEYKGLLVPKLGDVDVVRYRSGLLTFLKERLGPDRLHLSVSGFEAVPEGIRFRSTKGPHMAKIQLGTLVFWTPRLTSWVHSQASAFKEKQFWPHSARLWEQWMVNSREPIDRSTIGVFENMSVWADFEGSPETRTGELDRLAVLNPTLAISSEELVSARTLADWGSYFSFSKLSRLFLEFMRWEKFTVRNLKPRVLMDWPNRDAIFVSSATEAPRVHVVAGADGFLPSVVRQAKNASNDLLRTAK